MFMRVSPTPSLPAITVVSTAVAAKPHNSQLVQFMSARSLPAPIAGALPRGR